MAKPSALMLVPLSAVAFRSRGYAAGMLAGGAALRGLGRIVRDPLWAIVLSAADPRCFSAHRDASALGDSTARLRRRLVVHWKVAARGPRRVSVRGNGALAALTYYDLAWAIPLALLLLDRRPSLTILLYLYPTLAAVAWYYAGWDGGRLVVAALLLLGMALLGHASLEQHGGGILVQQRPIPALREYSGERPIGRDQRANRNP